MRHHQLFAKVSSAQKAAIEDAFRQYEKEAESKGLYARIGTVIRGRESDIVVTKAGLMAAVHRHGAGGTRIYFNKIDKAGGDSKHAPLDDDQVAIETRLRLFKDALYQPERAR